MAGTAEGNRRGEDAPPPIDGDADVVRGQRPPSSRVPLSRDRIVDAAVEFIDDQGLPGLSMRRLGTMLGVEAMALYRYVPGREQLLDAVVERIVDEMAEDPNVLNRPEHGWQDYLQRLAHGIRRVALTHPRAFPLVASRPAEAPWLRPPLRSLRWVEAFLEGLGQEGFSDVAAVEAYRAFTSFLLGHLLLEVAALGADLGPLDVVEEDVDASLAPYPNVRRLSGPLREDHSATEFEDSLENLLQRLALIRTES
jgi:AcrR family transcriptional regulator